MSWTLTLPFSTVLLSLGAGSLFGFFLRKGNVVRFDVIVGQLLLRDFTVLKVMLTAIFMASFLIYTLDAFQVLPTFRLSGTPLLFSALGGAIFAVGMSLSGYCPGTMVAAVADGAKDMLWGVFGMVIGSVLYIEASPFLAPYTSVHDAYYKLTLPQFFGISPFIVIVVFFLMALLLFIKLPKRGPGALTGKTTD